MSDPLKVPKWLQNLLLAPVYYPTKTEFSDPIAFISKIEQEASSFGICKIIPPLPKPSKKFVLSNLTRSLSPTFTTRHQELGTRKARHHKQQVWQSGEFYTLEQFESKSKIFRKTQLGEYKEVTPLLIETLFWKAALEKPIYVEYANDVPGSGFTVYRKKKKLLETISDSPWNLQAIAKAPGSLTRFMTDEVPGVTSPMVYIGMLFSWFAWHVEDHELHSLNFLHMGAAKTWYAVPGEYASALEEVVRVEGYGGDIDRLEAFTMLGEKTTLLSPEVIVNAGIPCCRLVQNPGEFVVTFPKAYHVGFSHGFNCGEAANFATPQWLKVAKEAAIRRAAMNYLPMLSHQQLLYMLTVSFASRVPRALLSGVRSSRLSDRKREEREILVKKAFLNDMKSENNLLCTLLQKVSTSYAVLWEPDLLPNSGTSSHPLPLAVSLGVQGSAVSDDEESNSSSAENDKNSSHAESISSIELLEILDAEEDDLPVGLKIDSGPLACVACGVLGYPFMAVMQPSERATKELFSTIAEEAHQNMEKPGSACIPSCLSYTAQKFGPERTCTISREQENPVPSFQLSPVRGDRVSLVNEPGAGGDLKLLSDSGQEGDTNIKTNPAAEIEQSEAIVSGTKKPFSEIHSLHCVAVQQSSCANMEWTSTNVFNRPRIFCLQHALEVEELLRSKGGVHVLIICHSDYLKIKAYTPAIAEEVGMGINIADVPLENASSSDLNLIYISIDDGEHEENGQDWTSKLGMNLRYCLKLRKQSTEKQEHLTLALGRIFSDSVSVSDFSTLRWHSKRSRTPYKVVGVSIADSHVDASMEKSDMVEKNLHTNFATTVKNYHSCRREANGLVSKHHCTNSEDIQTELGSSNGNLIVNGGNDCSTTSHSRRLNERVENDDARGLFTVPISAAAVEGLQIQQGSWFRLEVTRADKVTDSLNYESSLPCTLIPVLESSETCQGTNSQLEILTKCRADNSKNTECQPNLLQPEDVDSVVQQEIEAFDETNSDCKAYDIVDSVTVPTYVAVANSGDVQDIQVPQELDSVTVPTSYVPVANSEDVQDIQVPQEPSLMGSLGNIFPYSYQTPLLESSFENNEMHLEVSNSDVPKMEENIFHDSKLKGQLLCSLSTSDSLALMEKEIPKVNMSTKKLPIMEGCSNHSSRSVEHTVSNLTTINQCQMEMEFPPLKVSIAKEQLVDHLSTTDRLALMEKEIPKGNMSAEEVSMMETGANHSSRSVEHVFSNVEETSEGECVDHPSRVERGDTYDLWPEITSVENKSHGGMNNVQLPESSEVKESDKDKERYWSDNVCIIQYVRQRTKRKREAEQRAEGNNNKRNGSIIRTEREGKHIAECFIRSPCEGLRPRMGQAMTPSEKAGSTVKVLIKDKFEEPYECDIEGCRLKFRRKRDLKLHMQGWCAYDGCGKRFRSHKDLMKHQRVHGDERPLKCPWKGCQMSFKWEWARTEHLRIHTGERPYRCTVAGCELTFRYVSAFCRHRRKTGHCVNTVDHLIGS